MKRLLISIYGFAFFNKFLLLTPVYAIFMQQNGLSDFMLSSMFILSALGTIFGQFPVTLLTNKLGQRASMIVGQCLKAFAILLWLAIPNYIGFSVGMILWGVQAGFRSVAFEGLIYDNVAANGAKKDYTRILGRKSTYESVGTALSACGSLLMFLGYAWVTWLSVAAIAMSVVCLLMMHPMYRSNKKSIKSSGLISLFREGVLICLRTPCLLLTMILTLLVVNIPFLDDFLSPIGLQLGISTEYVGILSFFLLGCATMGQRFAYRFAHIPEWLLCALIGVVGVGYITFGYIYNTNSLWILGMSYMIFYGIYTLLYARFQNMIPTTHRSVVLSLYTTMTYIVYMLVCGVIGLGSIWGSWRHSVIILGVLMLALCVWAFVYARPHCKLTNDTIA